MLFRSGLSGQPSITQPTVESLEAASCSPPRQRLLLQEMRYRECLPGMCLTVQSHIRHSDAVVGSDGAVNADPRISRPKEFTAH